MTKTELHTTLREMWDTRPARPPDDRQVAGVAAALARRYDVDPVLVRVGFAVAGFAGIGALLYVAGWVALPDGRGAGPRPAVRALPAIALVVATMVGLGAVVAFDLGALLAGVVAVGLLVALHRNRAHLGTAAATPPAAPDATGTGATGVDPTGTSVAGSGPSDPQRRPPAWDPLGVAPYAWDLPEPSPIPPPPPGPRVAAVTLAAALLAGGVTGLVLLLAGGSVTILFGVLLAVLGTGLVAGAFLRSGRALVPIALVTAAIAWAVVAAPFDGWGGEYAEVRYAPAAAAGVLPLYSVGLGSLELDLRDVDLSVPPGTPTEPLRTAIRAEGGDVQVFVPPDADVTLRGDVGFGHVGFGELGSGGPDARLDVVDDLGADGVRTGRPIVLDVTAGFGNVEVHRG
ncbi:MAG: PspC domain-containing protein [Pseudonocardia sp.]